MSDPRADQYEAERDKLAQAIHRRVNSSRQRATVPYLVGVAERAAAAVVMEGWTPPVGYSDETPPARPTVERNMAFWNTWDDVNRELHEATRRLDCHTKGHVITWSSSDPTMHCSHCGADQDQIVADLRAQGHTVTVDGNAITWR